MIDPIRQRSGLRRSTLAQIQLDTIHVVPILGQSSTPQKVMSSGSSLNGFPMVIVMTHTGLCLSGANTTTFPSPYGFHQVPDGRRSAEYKTIVIRYQDGRQHLFPNF